MRQKDFDAAMKEFRGACVELAEREQSALTQRPMVMRAAPRGRWAVPAFAALLLAVGGGGWAAWERAHAPQSQGQVVAQTGEAAKSATVSDEALLSAVRSDLSDNVPQALEPLAVSYTGSKQARNGQEEVQ